MTNYVQPDPVVLVDSAGAPYAAGISVSPVKYVQPQPVVLVDRNGAPYRI